MSDKQPLTQKDLELVTDDGESDQTQPDAVQEAAPEPEDAAPKDAKPKQVSVLDDLGEDGEADPGGGESAEKAATDPEDADAETEAEAEKDAREFETKWRERVAEKILAPLRDQLSASKFEKRQKALMNELKRSKSIDDAIIRGIAAQEKIRSGQYKEKLSDDATEEEIAAWRKENGLPEKPEQYDIPKVPGHEWTEKDQPVIDEFRQIAHKINLPQEQVNELVSWQIRQQQKVEEEMEETLSRVDKEDREACHDALRAQYGVAEFKPHMSLMARLVSDKEVFGDDAGEKLISARYYDAESGTWRRVTSDPNIANALITLAKYEYGEGAMPGGDARVKSQDRLKEIEQIMKTDIDRYYREGLADEALELRRKEQSATQRRGGRSA